MKISLLTAIGFGLLCTTTYSESHTQIPCNIGGTPFYGTNYIQIVIHEKDITPPYWDPETQPAPLSMVEIIDRGKTAIERQFPGHAWHFDGLSLAKFPLSGWLYQIKYSIESTQEGSNNFMGFFLLVTPDGLVPRLVPDDNRIPDEATFNAANLAMVQKYASIWLPVGSRVLHTHQVHSPNNPAFIAKIHIPDTSGDELVLHLEELPNENDTIHGSITEDATWWNPSNGTIRIERQYTQNGKYIRTILTQENDMLALYLESINGTPNQPFQPTEHNVSRE